MAARKKATPKTPAQSARSARRARAAAPPATPTCPTCDRELQPGETIAELEASGRACIRCEYEQQHPGRDYDVDVAAANERGIRLASYVREQLTGETARH